jgi:hypothetical protein
MPHRTADHARRDFSHAWVVCNDRKTGQKHEGRQGHAATELLTKKIMSEVQKDSEDISAGKGQLKKIQHTRILSGI